MKYAWLLLAIIPLIASAHAHPELISGRLIRLHYSDVAQVRELAALGADICAHRRGFVEVMVPQQAQLEREAPELARAIARFPRQELIAADAGARARAIAADPDLGVYHTLAEVKAELDRVAQQHPSFTRLMVIGKSIEGRDIWALRIGSEPEDGKLPTFLFTGLHHAREWISVEVPMGIIANLTSRYATDPATKALVDGRTTFVVPVVNPDGLAHSQTQYQMWRKNRRNNGDGSMGVDPNRNYGYEWGGVGASASPSSDTYRGVGPFSEPETQAVRDLARTRRPVAAISFHSYSELVLWPWGYTSDVPPDNAQFVHHGQKMAEISGYTPQQSIDLYPTTGDFDDYMYGELNVLTYTIELGREFIPQESEVAGIVEKNVKCALYLIEHAAQPFPLLAHTPLATQTNPQGPYAIQANLRLASHPGFVARSVTAHWKRRGDAADGDFAAAELTASATDPSIWTGGIPGAGYGAYAYYLVVRGQDGTEHRFPPGGTYDFKVVEKLILVVCDDGGKQYDGYYTKALDAAGADYALWKVKAQGAVTSDALMASTACIWFTGSEYNATLTADDQALLAQYLAKGGRLLLFGQDIGYDIKESAFYKQGLSAKFVKDASGIETITGAGFLAGFAGGIGGGADSIKQQYPDVIEALSGAQALVTYGDGGPIAALAISAGTSRVAYFGFGLEGVGGEANRATLIAKALAWLSGSVEVALARSEVTARLATAASAAASEAMDEDLAARLAADVMAGRLEEVRALAARGGEGPARRVARSLLRRLPLVTTGPSADARALLTVR